MATITHDPPRSRTSPTAGLGLAVVSAATFGVSGTLATGLMAAGWSSTAAVAARALVAAAVLAPAAVRAVRGRWSVVGHRLGLIALYGLVAVAGCQLAYFNAVRRLDVGVALLVEYTAPVLVVLWAWASHGRRPGRRTTAGGAIAIAGLVLVLDLTGGVHASLPGMAWALAAAIGAAVYFVISAQEDDGLPPIVLAAGGLLFGGVALLLIGGLGLAPLAASTTSAVYGGRQVPFWLPIAGLGVLAGAVAYVTGIAAGRRLGARLASFVALLEVLFAVVYAWIFLDQIPHPVQLAGAVLVLGGVIVVKLGEESV